MPRKLDLDQWPRRDLYEFFRHFDQPFFNLCAPLDVTRLLERCRRDGLSYAAASGYLSMLAINSVEELRYRMRGDEVVVHDVTHYGATMLRKDETFVFGYVEMKGSYAQFEAEMKEETRRRVDGPKILEPDGGRDDLVYFSVIPWVSFTSFAHARMFGREDSIPRLVFGKYSEKRDGVWEMPVSLEVHHALADGLHAGRFFEDFQRRLNDLSDL